MAIITQEQYNEARDLWEESPRDGLAILLAGLLTSYQLSRIASALEWRNEQDRNAVRATWRSMKEDIEGWEATGDKEEIAHHRELLADFEAAHPELREGGDV